MSAPLSDLPRGAPCIALYPFTPGFPPYPFPRQAHEQGDPHAKNESYRTGEAGAGVEGGGLRVGLKHRAGLLLQMGTAEQRPDVLVVRVNSITDEHRAERVNWVRKLENNIHPFMLMVGHKDHHGLKKPSYVNLSTVQPVSKKAILRKVGQLT